MVDLWAVGYKFTEHIATSNYIAVNFYHFFAFLLADTQRG